MIFPTNRNGIKLREPKEDENSIFIVQKEFEGVSTFDVQIPGEFILKSIAYLIAGTVDGYKSGWENRKSRSIDL